MNVFQDDYCISTDKQKINTRLVHEYLSQQSYWSLGISLPVVIKTVENSLCFGIYKNEKQVGFTRVISDFATYAYLADVFVLPPERGKGLSKWLMKIILGHPELKGLRRFVLATKDAHGLYEQFGFKIYANPEMLMSIYNPDVYSSEK